MRSVCLLVCLFGAVLALDYGGTLCQGNDFTERYVNLTNACGMDFESAYCNLVFVYQTTDDFTDDELACQTALDEIMYCEYDLDGTANMTVYYNDVYVPYHYCYDDTMGYIGVPVQEMLYLAAQDACGCNAAFDNAQCILQAYSGYDEDCTLYTSPLQNSLYYTNETYQATFGSFYTLFYNNEWPAGYDMAGDYIYSSDLSDDFTITAAAVAWFKEACTGRDVDVTSQSCLVGYCASETYSECHSAEYAVYMVNYDNEEDPSVTEMNNIDALSCPDISCDDDGVAAIVAAVASDCMGDICNDDWYSPTYSSDCASVEYDLVYCYYYSDDAAITALYNEYMDCVPPVSYCPEEEVMMYFSWLADCSCDMMAPTADCMMNVCGAYYFDPTANVNCSAGVEGLETCYILTDSNDPSYANLTMFEMMLYTCPTPPPEQCTEENYPDTWAAVMDACMGCGMVDQNDTECYDYLCNDYDCIMSVVEISQCLESAEYTQQVEIYTVVAAMSSCAYNFSIDECMGDAFAASMADWSAACECDGTQPQPSAACLANICDDDSTSACYEAYDKLGWCLAWSTGDDEEFLMNVLPWQLVCDFNASTECDSSHLGQQLVSLANACDCDASDPTSCLVDICTKIQDPNCMHEAGKLLMCDGHVSAQTQGVFDAAKAAMDLCGVSSTHGSSGMTGSSSSSSTSVGTVPDNASATNGAGFTVLAALVAAALLL